MSANYIQTFIFSVFVSVPLNNSFIIIIIVSNIIGLVYWGLTP